MDGTPWRLLNQLIIYISIAWLITSFSFALQTFFAIYSVWVSLSYSASLSLCYNFSYLYSFIFIHQGVSVDVLKKLLLQFWKKKNICFEHIGKFSSKISIMESYLSALKRIPLSFSKICLEQLFCREHVSTCLCKNELFKIF